MAIDHPTSPPRLSGLAGLDRQAMERERLARLRNKRPVSEAFDLDNDTGRPGKATKTEDSSIGTPLRLTAASRAVSEFPQGAVKVTWCSGFTRADDMKIEEVLQKTSLKTALLSSWQIDTDWLFSKIDLRRTKTLLVMQSKDEKEQQAFRKDSADISQNLRLCFPPMRPGPYGTMHSKLMLLFHENYLRICVPSANLVPYDWGETGFMENILWLIDLPRRQERSPAPKANLTPFAHDLISFCQAMKIDQCFSDQSESLTEGLTNFDFTQTAHVRLVHTIPHPRTGTSASTTGYPLLAEAARYLLKKPWDRATAHYAVSSVGSLTQSHVASMYSAICGRSVPLPDGRKGSSTNEKTVLDFHIYYPSTSTVLASRGQLSAAGTLFMTPNFEKACQAGTFPLSTLRDSISRREGLLSHAKMLVAQSGSHSLIYVGSANFSPSAWGTLSWDRREKTPKFSANNWECGVLMLGSARDSEVYHLDGTPVPVPFKIPGPAYVQQGKDTRRPHMQRFQ